MAPIAFSRRLLGVGLLALCVTVLTGCQSAPKVLDPMRAVWVTRSDYRTADDIDRVMDNCAQAGFNAVIFQVRGNGTVFYPSDIEPWAEQYDYQDPGYDPLDHAIDQARARDMELHAWVNVMPAWRGPAEPTNPDQLYHTHPEWFWYDANGNRQPLNHVVGERRRGWYASVNPCLPEVRAYLVDVFREIVSRYDVDGLHLDYIRFPNEPVVRGEKIPDYPHDARTLALFHEATGKTPQSDPEAWNDWRTEQVNTLVADIHAMVRDENPRAVLSSAAGSVRERALHHFQDARAWMERGHIDAVFLMNYTPDVELFDKRIDPWLEIETDARVIPGMMVRRRNQPARDLETAQALIDTARARTGDYCVFAYSSIFGNTRADAPAAKASEFRGELVDYLADIAESE
jgi:uncharacterized lipoprotein YddW (UPF0748 family)